jgi:translation initiation factor IF-3
VKAEMSQVGNPDAEPKLLGKNISMMLSPLPAQKRVRKFTEEDIEDEIDTDDVETETSEERKA